MPFAVFRRYQKKMLAFLAVFAMVAFTLDFSLFRGRGSGGGEERPRHRQIVRPSRPPARP